MMNDLETIKKEVDLLADKLGRPIDEKIKPLVIGLKYHGIKTTASCQGHTDRGYPFPWVKVGALRPANTLLTAAQLLGGLGKANTWILKPEHGKYLLIPGDKKLPLEKLQEQAVEFGIFLQKMDR